MERRLRPLPKNGKFSLYLPFIEQKRAFLGDVRRSPEVSSAAAGLNEGIVPDMPAAVGDHRRGVTADAHAPGTSGNPNGGVFA